MEMESQETAGLPPETELLCPDIFDVSSLTVYVHCTYILLEQTVYSKQESYEQVNSAYILDVILMNDEDVEPIISRAARLLHEVNLKTKKYFSLTPKSKRQLTTSSAKMFTIQNHYAHDYADNL